MNFFLLLYYKTFMSGKLFWKIIYLLIYFLSAPIGRRGWKLYYARLRDLSLYFYKNATAANAAARAEELNLNYHQYQHQLYIHQLAMQQYQSYHQQQQQQQQLFTAQKDNLDSNSSNELFNLTYDSNFQDNHSNDHVTNGSGRSSNDGVESAKEKQIVKSDIEFDEENKQMNGNDISQLGHCMNGFFEGKKVDDRSIDFFPISEPMTNSSEEVEYVIDYYYCYSKFHRC